jgi:hypothetical protein
MGKKDKNTKATLKENKEKIIHDTESQENKSNKKKKKTQKKMQVLSDKQRLNKHKIKI